MRGVVLDLSHRGAARLLFCHIGHPLAVLAASSLDVTDEERLAEQVSRVVAEHGFAGAPMRVIMPRASVEAAALDMPAMPQRDLLNAARLELLREAEHPPLLSLCISPRSTPGGVVVYHMVQQERDAVLKALERHALQVAALVPAGDIPALALDAVVTGEQGTLWIEADATRLSLTLLRGDRWALERDFAYRLDGERALGEQDLERISAEVGRTVQFFKQKNRGIQVSRMLLCGCPDAVRDLLPHLRQTLVMESSIPTWSELGKGLKGPDSWSEGDGEAFWPFAPSFLLARAWTGKRPIADLLPEEIHEQRNFPRQVAMALVVMGLLLPLLWGVTRMLSRQKTQRERDLAQMEQMVATVRDQSQRLEERRRVRRDLLERRLTLNRPIKQVDLATRWILGLTHEVGAGIRLTQVRLEERFDPSGGWDVKVEGRVVDETFAQASQRISTLVARVREAHPQGGWVLTRSTVVDPIPSETGRDSRLGFTLTGHLEGGER